MSFSFSDYDSRALALQEHLISELQKIRTGRATVSILDDVTVEVYGGRMKLIEVASLSAPDATLLVVEPWDKSIIGDIEKAIQSAGLNVHPIVDGAVIRIQVPSLTEETRKDLVKKLHQTIEANKISARTLRSDIKKDIEQQKGSDGIGEDDIAADIAELEKKVHELLEKIESLLKQKEQDLLAL